MGRRLTANLIDGLVLIVLWQASMAISGVRFPFGIMQNFSRADYDAYVRVMTWLTLGVFLLSLVVNRLLGGSLGKIIMDLKTVQVDGAPMTLRQVIWRSLYLGLLGIMILAPGPLIAFVYGKGSEEASATSLMLGFLLLGVTTTGMINQRRQSVVEYWLGLVTVRRKSLP
jgi:uncharacterized RDD family membrane protein YckC